jgi:hypothetical protein
MAPKPARQAASFIPPGAVNIRAIAAAVSGAARHDPQCSSHKSRYLRPSAVSAAPSSSGALMAAPRFAAKSSGAAQ